MNKPIKITLKKIKDHNPCSDYGVLRKHLGESFPLDKEFPLSLALHVSGYKFDALDNVLWCFRAIPEYGDIVPRFAIWTARQVQHSIENKSAIALLDVSEKFLDGEATKEELDAASYAARDAARAARNAASYAASYAARDAARAARNAASDAASDAARNAARAAAWNAAWDAASDAQLKKLEQVLNSGEWIL